jgi:protein-disulfide isomerase
MMCYRRVLALVTAAVAVACGMPAQTAPAPESPKPGLSQSSMPGEAAPASIDKESLARYLRYAEGFTDSVKISIEDPKPTPFPGFYRLLVHLSAGDQRMDRSYYTDARGQQIFTGNIWDTSQSPFADNLHRLPDEQAAFGPADAKVTIVIFSDFQCPYCRQFAQTIRQNVPKKYPADVRVLFADFPLDKIHPWARAAAEAAHCVGDGNPEAFWAFHDWVFQNQGEFNTNNIPEKTLAFAKEKGWDTTKIGACLSGHAAASEVEKNHQAGLALQVQQTPTVFLNGRELGGALPWETVDHLIQMELSRAKQMQPALAPASRP